ncbi:hypothetical protein BH10ACT1_BH10ACT1_29320 [soil metagenome]
MSKRRWSDDSLMNALHAAALVCGEPLRVKAYRAWSADHDGRPDVEEITTWLGPWAEALDKAGLQVEQGRRRHR